MTRNPKLAKLKARMTPAEFKKRAEKMANRNTRHQETMQTIAQTHGNLNMMARVIGEKFAAQRRVNWLTFANTAGIVAVVGRVFGWW